MIETQDNEGPRVWQNLFTVMRFCYFGGFFSYILLLLHGVKKIICYTEDFLWVFYKN